MLCNGTVVLPKDRVSASCWLFSKYDPTCIPLWVCREFRAGLGAFKEVDTLLIRHSISTLPGNCCSGIKSSNWVVTRKCRGISIWVSEKCLLLLKTTE